MNLVRENLIEHHEILPSEYFHKPVIGKIITKPLVFGNNINFPSGEYDFIELENNIYICNQWYKEYKHIPQVVHKSMVEEEIKY
jgi:hypothetical protein